MKKEKKCFLFERLSEQRRMVFFFFDYLLFVVEVFMFLHYANEKATTL